MRSAAAARPRSPGSDTLGAVAARIKCLLIVQSTRGQSSTSLVVVVPAHIWFERSCRTRHSSPAKQLSRAKDGSASREVSSHAAHLTPLLEPLTAATGACRPVRAGQVFALLISMKLQHSQRASHDHLWAVHMCQDGTSLRRHFAPCCAVQILLCECSVSPSHALWAVWMCDPCLFHTLPASSISIARRALTTGKGTWRA